MNQDEFEQLFKQPGLNTDKLYFSKRPDRLAYAMDCLVTAATATRDQLAKGNNDANH